MKIVGQITNAVKARRERATPMRWWDYAILTATMFGPAIISSTQMLLSKPDSVEPVIPEFTPEQNWIVLGQQAGQLALSAGYILARNLKLVPWSIKPTLKGSLYGVGLFAACGLAFDLAYGAYQAVQQPDLETLPDGHETSQPEDVGATQAEGARHYAGGVDGSLAAYSVLNGFYEEFFFLVICHSLPTKHRASRLALSVLIRTSFHTYQGMFNALLIGAVFGVTFHLLSEKFPRQRIYPFVVAHIIGDLFGVGLLSLFSQKN